MGKQLPQDIEDAVNRLLVPWNINFSDILEKSSVSDNPPDQRRWLSIRSAEEYSGILRHTLRRAIKAQKIKCCKLGAAKSSKVLIELKSLDDWLDQCRVAPPKE